MLGLGLRGEFLEFGRQSLGAGIDDGTKHLLAEVGSVALGDAGADTLRHCDIFAGIFSRKKYAKMALGKVEESLLGGFAIKSSARTFFIAIGGRLMSSATRRHQ